MQHVLSRKTILALFALLFVLAVSAIALPQAVQAGGTECYTASYIERVNKGGSNHWRAVANVQAPVPSIGYWHVHGPLWAEPWPDSVTETYGKFYIYFSWPDWPNPPYGAGSFSACVN